MYSCGIRVMSQHSLTSVTQMARHGRVTGPLGQAIPSSIMH
jgi:hypothetical protein